MARQSGRRTIVAAALGGLLLAATSPVRSIPSAPDSLRPPGPGRQAGRVTRPAQPGRVRVAHDAGYIYLGNQYLEFVFRAGDGGLHSIIDQATNVDFIPTKNAWWSPFDFMYYRGGTATYVGGWLASSFQFSTRTPPGGVGLDLAWDGFTVEGQAIDVVVHVSIDVMHDSPVSLWTIDITDHQGLTIEAVDFPALSGLGRISVSPNDDYFVSSSMSGLLFANPLDNFAVNRGWGWELYYPSAYSPMQFMAYYGLNPRAGLYVAAYDGGAHSKFLDFSRSDASWLHAKIRHVPEFIPGQGVHLNYPVAIGVFSGDWYDAAQIYRAWALQQPWTAQGPLATRADVPGWYREAGLRQWIVTHPLCNEYNPFSLVPDVIHDTSSYMGRPSLANWIGWERQGWYGWYPDVFPPKEGWAAFRDAVAGVHSSGDRVLFVPDTTSYSDLASGWSSAEPSACRDRFGAYLSPFPFAECGEAATFYRMCPATAFWRQTLDGMLSTLAQEGADAIQLDGFPIFGPQPCAKTGHGHPPGGGTWWYENYRRLFGNFKTRARQANPSLALSSEGMAEAYIPLLDGFWDPFTTGWSPSSCTSWLADVNSVRQIPLWQTVYHDFALTESGITFVNRDAPSGAVGYGDFRDYYVRGFARALVWGELPTTWYADEKISQLNETQEREMAAYVRRIVDARTSYAQRFLVQGRMLREPALSVPLFHIDGAQRIPYTLDDYPPFDSPAVLGSAWKGLTGDAAIVLTNISHASVTFPLSLRAPDLLLPESDRFTVLSYLNGSTPSVLARDAALPLVFPVTLDPMDVALVELRTPPPPISFYTVAPCRLLDTRDATGTFGGPALAAGGDRVFPLVGRCGIPSTARALSVNLTVAQPTAQGNLRLYPAGTPLPLVSSINYVAGQTRANNAIAPLNGLGGLAIRCTQASGTAHFILDVNGYFE